MVDAAWVGSSQRLNTIIIYTSKEPVCPRVELIFKIIIILLIIFLGFINSIPLIPACTARPGLPLSPPEIAFLESPYYQPQTASIAITQQTSIQSPTHKAMTLHSKPDPTMITNHFCACGLFSKWDIRQNSFVFVEVWTTFFRVSTCFNGSAAAMDAQLGFGTRLRWFCDRGVW